MKTKLTKENTLTANTLSMLLKEASSSGSSTGDVNMELPSITGIRSLYAQGLLTEEQFRAILANVFEAQITTQIEDTLDHMFMKLVNK